MRFENLISFESGVTPLGLAVGIAGVAALAYYLGRRDGVTRATPQQLADELERRAAVDPAILKPVVDLFLARQRKISGWRPTFMSGTRPGTGIYQYLFKPSMNGAAAYVFCRKENKRYVLLNVQSREDGQGGMNNVADMPCGFADNLQVERVMNQLIVQRLGQALKINPELSVAEQSAIVDDIIKEIAQGKHDSSIAADCDLEKTARRELEEESGLTLDGDIIGRLFALMNFRQGSYYIAHFVFNYTDVDIGGFPKLKPQKEEGIKSCHWVCVDDISFTQVDGNGGVAATVELDGKVYSFKSFDQVPRMLAAAIEYQGLRAKGLRHRVTTFDEDKAPMMVSNMDDRYQMSDALSGVASHSTVRVC